MESPRPLGNRVRHSRKSSGQGSTNSSIGSTKITRVSDLKVSLRIVKREQIDV